ncbi:MAG: protein kinase, partial [Myxococcota bacterium]|nr:protein kinase [Myxococcota bacterium]
MSAPSSYPRAYGSYLLLESLGQGGMSEVELARKAVDDARYVRFMVIKRIHTRHTAEPGFVRMFQDEARINAELQHENIAQVYDFGQVGDEWYIAREYIPGLDLRGVVRRVQDGGGRLPVPIALRIVSDVLKALQYAHGRVDTYGRPMNIVHRDVNPRNVMLSVRGEVKLIDFGVAKADTRSEQTKGEVIKGKFAYMAPEQIESGAAVDGRADLFAVGLMLYELLAGEHPFAGLREIQIVHRVLAGRIPVLPSVADGADPVALRTVVRRALSMKPDERFPDGASFREALEHAARAVGGVASTPDLAAFVRSLDPGRAEGISQRLEAWRDMQLPPVISGTDPETGPAASPQTTPASHPTDQPAGSARPSPLGRPDPLPTVREATHPGEKLPGSSHTKPPAATAIEKPGPP